MTDRRRFGVALAAVIAHAGLCVYGVLGDHDSLVPMVPLLVAACLVTVGLLAWAFRGGRS